MGYNDDAKQMMVRLQEKMTPGLADRIAEEVVGLGPEAFKLLITFPEVLVYAGLRRWVIALALKMKRDDVMPMLLEALSHPDWRINQIAREAFAKMGTDVRDELVETLEESESHWGRLQALHCLHRLADPLGPLEIGDESLIPFIEKAAGSDESEEVRGAALAILSRSDASGAEATIVRSLEDPAQSVRLQAVRAAGRLGLKGAVGPLTGMLEGAGPELSAEIIYALDRIGDVGAAGAVRGALSGGDWYVRWTAAKALERLWEPDNVEPLRRGAEDDNALVSIAAIETVALKAPAEAEDILRAAAASEDPGVRGTAQFYAARL